MKNMKRKGINSNIYAFCYEKIIIMLNIYIFFDIILAVAVNKRSKLSIYFREQTFGESLYK